MEKLGQNEIYSQLLGQHPVLRTYKGEDLINEYTPLYTPPLDWRDIRSDCPNNSIALYAAHGRINNPNYNIKKVTGAVKYTVVGNPTIIDGIASNFSTSNYLRTSSNWAQINTKFDIVICARPSGGSALMCIGSGESGKMKLYFSTSKITFQTGNSSQDELAIETTFSNNLFYYIRIKRNENTTFLSYSTDGTNWQSEISGNLVYTSQSNFMRFGYNANIPSTFGGSIDLNQTYVKVNNEIWFGSQMQLISANPNIYLQSSGTQYIDTGLKGVTNFELDAQGVTASNTSQVVISRNSPDGNFFGQFYNTQKWGMNGSSVSANYTTRCQFDITFDSTGCEYTYEGTTYRVNGTAALTNNFYLYRANSSNPYVASCKIFSCKAYQNDTLVQHLVPVPQGLVIGSFTCPSNGMFDIVEQKFYSNQGTGDFTYGNNSPETITYDNLGFTATCIGGYKVFIDGNQYGGIHTSGSQCNIIWSQSGINTGNNIITPSALKAHKIWIEPVIDGNNITAFKCQRVAASGSEEQGVLWAHFNIVNSIEINSAFNNFNTVVQDLLKAITAKNNLLTFDGPLYWSFNYNSALEYLPVLKQFSSNYIAANQWLALAKITQLTVKNFKPSSLQFAFAGTDNLTKINYKEWDLSQCNIIYLPSYSNYENVDLINNNILTRFVLSGTSTKLSTLKSLRISNEAPFTGTAPQINVSYTGMDRQALVTLFNDLPTVADGQIINVTGCIGNQDKLTIVGSPTISNGVISGFSSSNYAKTSSLPDFSGDCEIVIPFNVADLSSTQYLMSWIVSGFSCGIKITTEGKIDIYFSRSGDSSTALSIVGNHTYSTNTNNKMKLVKEGNTLSLYYWNNGWVFDKSSTNENAGTITVASYFRIGVSPSYNPQSPLNGSIDLNNTYIKVNDELFFGREQYLLPEDKAIATNKGWTLTL